MLEADQRPRLSPVGNPVDGDPLEGGPEAFGYRWDGEGQPLAAADSRDEIRFRQQTDGSEPPVPLQHYEFPVVRSFHHHQRLNVEVTVGGHRLQQFVEFSTAVEFGDQCLVG